MVIYILYMGNENVTRFPTGTIYSSFTGAMMIFTKFFESFEQLYTEVLHENEQSTLVVERSKKNMEAPVPPVQQQVPQQSLLCNV